MKLKKAGTTLALFIIIFICAVTPSFAAQTPEVEGLSTFLEMIADKAGVEHDFEVLRTTGVLSPVEVEYIMQYNCVTYALAWEVAWPLYGFQPYPANCYSIKLEQDPLGYQSGWAAAVNAGAADPAEDKNKPLTANEVKEIFTALDAGLEAPEVEINCSYIDKNDEWTRQTAKGRNGLILGWGDVPEAWKKDFEKKGWQFKFEVPDKFETEFGEWTARQVAGLTNYAEKSIAIVAESGNVALHEMAHFASFQMGWDNRLAAVYDKEAANTEGFINPYGRSHRYEYIAETAVFWITHNEEEREAFKSVAPKSAAMAEELLLYKVRYR